MKGSYYDSPMFNIIRPKFTDTIVEDSFRLLISKNTVKKFYNNFDINHTVELEYNYSLLDKSIVKSIYAKKTNNELRYNKYKMIMKCILDEYPHECNLSKAFLQLIHHDGGDFINEILYYSKEITQRIVKEKIYAKIESNDSGRDSSAETRERQRVPFNLLGRIVLSGRLQEFIKVVKCLLDICDVNNWKELEASEILNEKMMLEWIDLCNSSRIKREKYPVFGSFLTNVIERVWKKKNWDVFCVMFGIDSNEQDQQQEQNEEVEELSIQFGKDYKCAQYLLNNCEKDTLVDLANVINDGLQKRECGFNDSLLILAKMTDNEKFLRTLSNVTEECLTHEKKNIFKHCFFKNNLLHSSIWTMEKEKEKEEKHDDDVANINKSKLLFDEVKEKIVLNELKYQQMFIQNSIINEEKNNHENWQKLKQFGVKKEVASNDDGNMEKCSKLLQFENHKIKACELLHVRYPLNTLPFDNVNGFDGSKEYDHNGYLTELLILAHQTDMKFQNECKKMFNIGNKDFGIKCIFSSGSVKTRARSITKCELDYKNEKYKWPHSQHLKDLLRCSVVFDSIEDLLKGCEKFEKIMNKRTENEIADDRKKDKNLSDTTCMKEIIRVKNGFTEIKNESWKLSLNSFNYTDIKYNILIETAKKRKSHKADKTTCIIGEVQFLLRFMLNAKKMGHSIYSFVRKEDLFNNINKIVNLNNFNVIQRRIKKMIISKNMTQLSVYFENIKENQLKWIVNNKKDFVYLFEQMGWKKGLKLFNIYVN